MYGTSDFVPIVAFLLICFIVALGWWLVRLFIKLDGSTGTKRSQQHRGYGINYMMRRRRLDLSNPNSSFRTSIGTKIRRQRTGIFGRRKK